MSTKSGGHSGDRTRSLVFDRIRSAGGTSRVELAAATGLTEATISTVVRRMIADGLVEEIGQSTSTGGKPRTLLGISGGSRFAVGVSLARDETQLVITDLTGRMIARSSSRGAGDLYPDAIVGGISTAVTTLVGASGVDPALVVGIGVASPGPLDSWSGVLQGEQPTPAWRGFPLAERLGSATGSRVVVDNDATCAALGEHWTRTGSPISAASATVYFADGIGGGILIDGQAFHGASSNAGEIGHISLDRDGPLCHCGARGCVEVFASRASVASRARADDTLARRLGLGTGDSRHDFDLVARAAMGDDSASLALLTSAAEAVAQGVVTLANILDLEEVHLTGPGFSIAGELYRRIVQGALDAGTFMRRIHGVRVVVSELGIEAAALGAAALMLQLELTPHAAAHRRSS